MSFNAITPKPQACPLCNSAGSQFYHRDQRREYWQCVQCGLVFVPEVFHLTPAAEKAEYDLHRNDPHDPGYRRFLSRLSTPLLARLSAGSCGLDFGCGPGPTLSLMLEAAGHEVELYDVFYAKQEAVWQRQYQFITATEVVEHLAQPGRELTRLWQHLTEGGVLAIMTKRVIDHQRFASWHYKNDPTHIAFFSEQTLRWLAARWQAEVAFPASDVVLFSKPQHAGD